ncbi:MAG: hypothetical protein ACTSPB_00185 [Candidatus Thorarchaeota archaeon]
MTEYDYIAECNCGAITINVNGKDYSMTKETFKSKFGKLPDNIEGQYGAVTIV